MPQITFTEELGIALKELRKENKITAKSLSEILGKSNTYISKLESGSIKKIDIDEIDKIFHAIFKDNEKFNIHFDEFIAKCSISLTKSEIEEEDWLLNFDTVLRKIPVPSDLVDYINQVLINANKSIAEIVARVNLNEDIPCDKKLFKDKGVNLWHTINEKTCIFIEMSYEEIERILQKKQTECNFVTLNAFLFNLNKFLYSDNNIITEKTLNTLYDFKFYTIREQRERLSQSHSEVEVEEILTDFDKINRKLLGDILGGLSTFSDFDIMYSNDKLTSLLKNLKADLSLTMAFIGIDISPLKDFDVETKRNFMKDVVSTVKKYSENAPKTEKLTLI